jgi:hypothetical protein
MALYNKNLLIKVFSPLKGLSKINGVSESCLALKNLWQKRKKC